MLVMLDSENIKFIFLQKFHFCELILVILDSEKLKFIFHQKFRF